MRDTEFVPEKIFLREALYGFQRKAERHRDRCIPTQIHPDHTGLYLQKEELWEEIQDTWCPQANLQLQLLQSLLSRLLPPLVPHLLLCHQEVPLWPECVQIPRSIVHQDMRTEREMWHALTELHVYCILFATTLCVALSVWLFCIIVIVLSHLVVSHCLKSCYKLLCRCLW